MKPLSILLLVSILLASGCQAPDSTQIESVTEGNAPGDGAPAGKSGQDPGNHPWIQVLGIAQDAGVPQAGAHGHPAWDDPTRTRRATSLGLFDPVSGKRWIFEATPDFPEQWYDLDRYSGDTGGAPDGIFLTHAHIGHYTGLMFLGHESMGASNVDVFALPRMAEFLATNGPWDQLVRYENIQLQVMTADSSIDLTPGLRIIPFMVPHRQEYSEVAGYRIDGPNRSALFIPDIDAWEDLDSLGVRIEELIAGVDVAWLDATFYANGEIPGRDMSGFPHPFITHSMERFVDLPESEKAKIRFIHLNHTNPALDLDGAAYGTILAGGFGVAHRGDREGM